MLLKLVESMIETVEQQCLDKHLLPVFKKFLSGNKFGAVVDGMNVALWGHQHKYSFDHRVVCSIDPRASPLDRRSKIIE